MTKTRPVCATFIASKAEEANADKIAKKFL